MNSEVNIEKFVHDLSVTGIHYRCMGEIDLSSRILKATEIIKHQKAEIERLKKYDEERDIRLHAKLIDTTRTETLNDFVLTVKRADPCCNSMLLDEIKERMLRNEE